MFAVSSTYFQFLTKTRPLGKMDLLNDCDVCLTTMQKNVSQELSVFLGSEPNGLVSFAFSFLGGFLLHFGLKTWLVGSWQLKSNTYKGQPFEKAAVQKVPDTVLSL